MSFCVWDASLRMIFVSRVIHLPVNFHTFSSISFSVSDFMLRSMFHLKLSFLWVNNYGSVGFFSLQPSRMTNSFCWRCYLLPVYTFGFFIKIRCVDFCICLQSESVDHYVCFYANTMKFLLLHLYYNLKLGMVIPLAVLILFRLVFSYPVFCFPPQGENIVFSRAVKNY